MLACDDSKGGIVEQKQAKRLLERAEMTENPEQALELCDRVIGAKAAPAAERKEALMLKADRALELDDYDAAEGALDALGQLTLSVEEVMRAGWLRFDLDQLDEAERLFTRARAEDPTSAEPLYGLGMVAERRGEDKPKAKLWLEVLERDGREPRPPWALTPAEFERRVESAMRRLPDRARDRLANVPVLVEDLPSRELVLEGLDPRLLGLFSGVPYPEQSFLGPGGSLETVHLYQRNIERAVDSPAELVDQIEITLLHEIAHFFGMSEEDLKEIGLD
jgi:predicted Zn-dependent protease with MMP-like domain